MNPFLIKLLIPLGVLAVLVVGVGLIHHRGVVAGRAEVQTRFDSYVARSDAIAAKAEKDARDKEDKAKVLNEKTISDYKLQLASSDAYGQSLSRKLRLAIAKAGGGGVPQGPDQPGAAGPSPQGGLAEIADAVGRTASECRDNDDQLDALIKEISPQVTP